MLKKNAVGQQRISRALVFAAVMATLVAGCSQSGSEAPATSPATGSEAVAQLVVSQDGPDNITPVQVWSARAELPVERVELSCATVGDKIYAIGGIAAGRQAVARLDIYDTGADSWSQGPDAPMALHHAGVAVHGNTIYLFGGYVGAVPFAGVSSVFRYDLGSASWGVETSLPRPRGGHATIQAGADVYLVGGAATQPGSLYTVVDVYNFTTKQWRQAPDAKTPRDHLTGGFAGGEVIATGGRAFSFSSNMATTEAMIPGEPSWSQRPPMPTKRGGIASAVWEDLLYVFGGEADAGTMDDVEAYNPASRSWYKAPALPEGIHAPCASAAADGIHLIAGGHQPGFTTSKQHLVLDVAKLRVAV